MRARTLLVGYGDMVRNHHLPALECSPDGIPVGIVRARAGASCEQGLPVFNDLEHALEALSPDLVVISTPHRLHFEQTRCCLLHGCHVLVDKPTALHLDEVEALVALAASRGKLLVEGLQRRYEELMCVFRELIGQGRLGDLRMVHGFFAHRFGAMPEGSWRADPQSVGNGILDDSAVHLIDLLVAMAGEGQKELRLHFLSSPVNGMCHSFSAMYKTERETLVSAVGSYLSPAHSVQEEISVLGTKGSLFGRRFCIEHNIEPPMVVFKSADGGEVVDFDLSQRPSGRALPLKTILSVLSGRSDRSLLKTEAHQTLGSHRVLDLMRRAAVVPLERSGGLTPGISL